jgi:hypothetical protein
MDFKSRFQGKITHINKNGTIDGVNQTSLNNAFKEWFQMNYGNRKAPKLSELIEAMNKKFGNKNTKSNKWHNIKIKEDEDMEGEDDIEQL